MIVTSITDGFGNQLFQYAAGYAAARRAGTTLRLNTRFYRHNQSRQYQLDRLKITGRPLSTPEWLGVRLTRQGGLPGPLAAVRRAVGIADRPVLRQAGHEGFTPEVLRIGPGGVLVGFWQNEAYFVDYADDIRQQFQFKHPPNEYNRALLADMARQPSVCLHVRRGDYLTPGQKLTPASVTYYTAALARMAEYAPGAKYYVFSDDPAWAHANLPLPPNHTLVTGNLGVSDTDDLRLMTHCDHFIIANSTFSWWGAWLARSPEKRVIAPVRWFREPHPNDALIVPQRWERLAE